ncbi:MAG: peptide chain release factor N(5)-glutamine methyltransferase [Paludibacterium sp.]|uniref:peptide chain release factor N(5)-glutamine methyltransferase n=1 Tax=Paludibacterium sp. TaxID=1917523 RepID=UPI0025D1E897|nr:peptide chain release factor N(5)-glutamine methyltransferase [Paludibacterium sp.]MBV8049110.1 peptide chain release factor N(5)-glutamine methyltransferase [Paludibacterium sp.]MBV8648340.1 peptide chain release factor N(5)-glutamine methyltransferase [Paludibacterium sp.]
MTTIASALAAYPLPRLESRLLLMHVVPELTHARIVGYPERVLASDVYARFCALAERRVAGEPLAYLLGMREFYGRPFAVTPDVLIPRPETEHLVEAALARVGHQPAEVLDLGCGSGAIAVTLALEAPSWRVSAVDVSAAALTVARGNAERLGARVDFLQGSWFAPLPPGGCFQLIVSNPPYIAASDHHLDEGDVRFEPRLALTDGGDGLACLREIAAGAPARLAPGGWLMVEHGYDQGEAMRALLAAQGFVEVETLPDLAGLDRVTLGRRP